MPGHAPYCIEVHPANALENLRTDEQVFAIIRSGCQTNLVAGNPLDFEIPLPAIGSDKIEVWRSNNHMTSGSFKQVNYKHSDTFIFGNLLLHQPAYKNLTLATKSAYQQIHDTLEITGFPSLLRMWNIFPNINENDQELERYRSFCLGRHQALSSWHLLKKQLPAASAIGSKNGEFLIYFLAARQPGIQIENPRQISASDYPMRYGPKSPNFSRATLKNWGKDQHLYISGTASIVGHETRHRRDYIAQLEETLVNINTIIDQANNMYALPCTDFSDLDAIRVYIRNPQHADSILDMLYAKSASECQIQAIQGDICRSDLLLEIEGFFTS
jgi:chorismate lyase/3-hydroxybenzoate synthase